MKVSCGTDIIEIERIKKSIEHIGKKFLDTVFTEREVEYCESHFNNRYQHYAARFAAKEAIYKALNKLSDSKVVSWKDFEIINNEDGKPEVSIDDDRIQSIDISLAHCKEYAVANVVILYE